MTTADPGWRALLGQTKRSFWLLFGGVWLLAGLILFVVGIGTTIEERRWADASTTTGMVLTKEIVPADSDSSTEYRVAFRFVNERGETVEGEDQVEVSIWEALRERGPVDVHHLAGSSEPARLDADPDVVGSVIFLLAGLGTAVVGGFLFGRAARALLRARRLLATGVDVDATVTAVEGTDVSYNRRPQYRVRYSYRAAGARHVGDSGYLESEEASDYAEGDTVRIRYDPTRPGDSVWLGRPMMSALAGPTGPEPTIEVPPPG